MKPIAIARTALALAVLLSPVLVSAQMYTQNLNTGYTMGFVSTSGGFGYFGGGGCGGGTIICVAETILFLINSVLIPVLFAVAFIVFLYGIAKAYIFSVGDPEGVKAGHKLLLWGIIGFAVMVSLWGLVNVVTNTFGLNGGQISAPPYSPYPVNNI